MAETMHALVENPAERRPIDIGLVPAHKRKLWLPIVQVGNDPFDSATQKKTGPVITIERGRIVETWIVRDKTAEEIAAEKANELRIVNERRTAMALPALSLDEYEAFLKGA